MKGLADWIVGKTTRYFRCPVCDTPDVQYMSCIERAVLTCRVCGETGSYDLPYPREAV